MVGWTVIDFWRNERWTMDINFLLDVTRTRGGIIYV